MEEDKMQQKIRFFLSAEKLAEVVGDGEIRGLFLDFGFKGDEKVKIWVSAVGKEDTDPEQAERSSQPAIPTPPGGTRDEDPNTPSDGSPTFSDLFRKK